MNKPAPGLDSPIYFRVSPDERARLQRLQEQLGNLTLSQTVRLAVRDGLDALERSTTRVRRGAGVLAALARTRR